MLLLFGHLFHSLLLLKHPLNVPKLGSLLGQLLGTFILGRSGRFGLGNHFLVPDSITFVLVLDQRLDKLSIVVATVQLNVNIG